MQDATTLNCDAETPALLLVEDSLTIRDLLMSFLRHSGYQVISCSSAESALNCLQNYRGNLQLLITDVVLEGLSGFGLATELRKNRAALPVIFISGFAAAPESVAIENSIYLEKPFSLQALRNAVVQLLSANSRKAG